MIIRHYPVVISKDENGLFHASCPDLELSVEIHGYERITDVCGCAMSIVHQYTTSLKQNGMPLPPATPMELAEKYHPEGMVKLFRVIVCQAEENDNYEKINPYKPT